MILNIKQGFYKITNKDEVIDIFFLDEENIFVCSTGIDKLVGRNLKETILDIKKGNSSFVNEKAIFLETISKNIATNKTIKTIEKAGIVNATFQYIEINKGNMRGILSQVVRIKYPLTRKEEIYSSNYIIENIKKYELLIDEKWHKAKLSKKEHDLIQKDLRGKIGTAHNIVLENGEIIEIGIIDGIKEGY